MSIESISSIEWGWRCKWLQMAEEARKPPALSKGGIDPIGVHEERQNRLSL
jgi:hypothetical protein